MNDSSIAFGNLGPVEVALLCAAVLLLFGARDLSALNAVDARRRAMARGGYLLSALGGFGFGLALAVFVVPTRLIALLLVAVAICPSLVAPGWSRPSVARRIRWDLGMAGASLLSCGITMDVIAWFWAR